MHHFYPEHINILTPSYRRESLWVGKGIKINENTMKIESLMFEFHGVGSQTSSIFPSQPPVVDWSFACRIFEQALFLLSESVSVMLH